MIRRFFSFFLKEIWVFEGSSEESVCGVIGLINVDVFIWDLEVSLE
jgi:hypothetical protein